ncbi:MAG: peptidase [Caulobacter sp.]|nr:peptidase [Caulobacter sp.]
MKRLIIAVALLAAGPVVAQAAAPTAKPYVGHELAKSAHVSLEQAQAIALKSRPGKVTDKELEKESGGSGLRYSFDIVADGKTYEVGVDAANGKVLENAAEGKNPD